MSSPLSVLSVEARREAASLVVDVAGERRAEMAGHQPRARAGAMLQRLAPALARAYGFGAGEGIPFRMIDLQRVVQDVAAEQPLLALRFELDGDGAGRVAGRRLDLEVFVEL